MMQIKSTSIGLVLLCAALVGCNSQNESSAGSEDAGQFPDTTATEGNMMLPSDDAATAPETTASDAVATSATPAAGL